MEEKEIETIAHQLLKAHEMGQSIPPITESYPTLGIDDAYQIQFHLLEKKLKKGEKLIGWKVGVTSQAVMEQLGMFEPIFGHLMDSSICKEGAPIPFNSFIQPGIEPEIAFRIASNLKGPITQVEKVLESTDAVFPAIEIVDSRIKDWKIKPPDAIADNALHYGILVGSRGISPKTIDFCKEGVQVEINGRVVASGLASAVLGTPINSVVILTNKLSEFGISLRPGAIVMTGSITQFLRVGRGDEVRVIFSTLGVLEARFT